MLVIKYKQEALLLQRDRARRAMLVNSCYVSRGTGVRKASNSESDLQDLSRVLQKRYPRGGDGAIAHPLDGCWPKNLDARPIKSRF